MGKIHTSQIHKSENASIWYGGIIVDTIRQIRRSIESLKKSKKADQSALGGIHALRKLIEDEESYFGLAEGEVNEWIIIIEEWFKRVKRYISKDIQDEFKKNIDADLAIILDKSTNRPEYTWRKKSLERQITITVKSEEVKEQYYLQTEQKHPVDLGNSLNEYLKKCLNNLLDDQTMSTETPKKRTLDKVLNLTVMKNNTSYTLMFDNFNFYNSDENEEQDIVLNAYDIEDIVKSYLDINSKFNLALFKFDCESSLFSVTCEDIEPLKQINDILLSIKPNDVRK